MFSTRRRQIEAELDRAGQTGPAAAQRACLTTRPAKTNVPEHSLRDRWADQTREAGYDPQRLVYGLLGRQRPPALPDLAVLQTELLGPGGVTRHATSFDRGDLLQALCQTLPAGLPVDHQCLEHLADGVLAAGDTVPLLTRDDDGQRRHSTAELLSAEGRALALAEHLRRQPGAPMNTATIASATADSRLSAEQAAVIQQLADSTGISLIVGPAGAGKTAALAQHTGRGRPPRSRTAMASRSSPSAGPTSHTSTRSYAPHSSPKASSEQHHCICAPTTQPTLRLRLTRDADR